MYRSVFASLLGIAICVPAVAVTVHTSSVLDSFSIQVADLRPDDAARPWVWAQNSISQTRSSASYGPDVEMDEVAEWRQTTSVSNAVGSASTSRTTFQAAASLIDAGTGEYQLGASYAWTSAVQVLLAPYTSLTLSGSFTASIFSDAIGESSNSSVRAYVYVGTGNGLIDEFLWQVYGAADGTVSDVLSVTFANATDRANVVQLGVGVQATAAILGETGVAAVVPEPSSWALMAAGGLLVAGWARRTRDA